MKRSRRVVEDVLNLLSQRVPLCHAHVSGSWSVSVRVQRKRRSLIRCLHSVVDIQLSEHVLQMEAHRIL